MTSRNGLQHKTSAYQARFIPPMLLKLVQRLPEGEQWQYEVKWDGYRGIVVLNNGKVQLISRNEKDLSKRFPRIVEALERLNVTNAVIDGEIVVLNDEGKPSFESLQYFEPKNKNRLFYYAFDLLHLKGEDLTGLPLVQRRNALEELLVAAPPAIRLSSTLEGTPEQLIEVLRAQQLEGIVAKKKDSSYEAGKRSGAWQKLKLNREEKFLICGFIPNGKQGVKSLVLGIKENDSLRYVACLDLHLPVQKSRSIAAKLDEITTAKCPFSEIPEREPGNSWSGGMTAEELAAGIWVQPKLKAEVTFLEWTRGGFLRHAQVKHVLV